MTCSGRPLKRLRSTGSCVATPTGQVLRWHLRIMMQPAAISGAVEKPNSSAPSRAAITTSRPVRRPPSACKRHAAAQAVEHQRLLRLGEADLPGRAGMLERGEGRRARAALEARDRDVVGARLGDARRHRADADFRDELHRHVGRRVDVLQVEDQLRQILDRIDVVVRRRRDQADARRRVAHAGDLGVDLVAGQLSAFAGLGALRDLDLHHVGIDEIFRRHAEAAGGHLLDGGALGACRRRAGGSAPAPRRPRRCSTCRRWSSWRAPGSRAPRFEIEPKDMAPVEKRLTMSCAGSTSFSGDGRAAGLLGDS